MAAGKNFTVEKDGIRLKYVLKSLKPRGPVIVLCDRDKEAVFAFHYFRIYYSDGTTEYGATDENGEYDLENFVPGDIEIELLSPTDENPLYEEEPEESLPDTAQADIDIKYDCNYGFEDESGSEVTGDPGNLEIILMDIDGKILPGIPCIIERDGEQLNVETDQEGKIKDRISSIRFENESFGYEEQYGNEYMPLPAFLLRNRADGGEGPLQKGDPREKLVKYLQESLIALGIVPEDVHGTFGKGTENAVKEFQKYNSDYEGKPLDVDGKVGPRSADCINRRLVGIWFPKHETDQELLEGLRLITVTPAFLNSSGLPLEPGNNKTIKLMVNFPSISRETYSA